MVYLASGNFWLLVGQGISMAAGLLSAIAFANLLPKEIYGEYRFILSAVGVLAAFSLPGINTAVSRAVARGEEGMLMPGLWARIRYGTIGAIISLALCAYYAFLGNPTLSFGFGIAAAFLPFMDPLSVYAAARNGKGEFRFSSLTEGFTGVVTTIVLVSLLFLTNNVVIFLLAYFISTLLMRLLYFLRTRRLFPKTDGESSAMLAYGKHLSVIYILSSAAVNLPQLLLFHYAGAAAVAAIAFAMIAPDQLRSLMKNLSTVLYPRYAKLNASEARTALTAELPLMALLGFALATCYIVLAPWLFATFFPKYMEAIVYTQLLTLSIVDVLTLLPLAFLRAQRMLRRLYTYQVVTSIVQAGLLFVGIQMDGVIGLIWGMILGRVFSVLYIHILVYFYTYRSHAP
jgi:O-antigen/teichoic acid export membrane protein